MLNPVSGIHFRITQSKYFAFNRFIIYKSKIKYKKNQSFLTFPTRDC